MKERKRTSLIVSALIMPVPLMHIHTGSAATNQTAEGYPIAGTAPQQRPANAPTVPPVTNRSKEWYQKALTGVSEPYPPSLNFLDNQGNWYTPFTRPGMVGPYDIRRWHSKTNKGE